eukprot:9603998-Heterocapsa_arctica.AAC.1
MTSGELIEFTLDAWVHDGQWARYTLVLLGRAQYGKTPAAMAMAAFLARALQPDAERPHFVK